MIPPGLRFLADKMGAKPPALFASFLGLLGKASRLRGDLLLEVWPENSESVCPVPGGPDPVSALKSPLTQLGQHWKGSVTAVGEQEHVTPESQRDVAGGAERVGTPDSRPPQPLSSWVALVSSSVKKKKIIK